MSLKINMSSDLRRKNALNRLVNQLKVGKKKQKISGKTTLNVIDLTDKDILRINKEIENLKSKV